ncbi:FG-GAP-like repeat-containing protein [Streptomyces orinoci]|uniref:FG-GAP-like repeat-containing protein n=1 Tax=Streptomyces orinoci TaxID=67339 RepID=A0ABV3K829_STRON|nr:FG-GAP-like repeat-containing protein [Streptomyces orinoci]
MTTALLTGLMTTISAATGASTASAASSVTDNPNWKVPRLAVMPMGDSITRGVGSSTGAGYRTELRDQLASHTDDLHFVGTGRPAGSPGLDHEGHPGWRIDELSDNVERWLASAHPNVVLLHIGTNDMDQNYAPDAAPERLGGLIDQITTAAPGVTVLVSSVVPSKDPQVEKRVEKFNLAVPQIVAERRNKGRAVGYVDMGDVTTADLADRLHPSDSGYVKMARAFFRGVSQAATDGWIHPNVDVKPAPPYRTPVGDYNVDINGDGKADFLSVDKKGAVHAWLNNGGDSHGGWPNYGWIATGTGAPADKVRFADINGDGKADYLVLDDDGGIQVWLNNGGDGHGGWTNYGRIATGAKAPASKVRFADINGDGKADYLVLDDSGAVHAWLNNGTSTWTDYGQIATGTGAQGNKVRFADIDGDGKADYLIVDDNGAVHAWLNKGGDGHGGWADRGQIATGTGAPGSCVRFADIDGDGKADYLVVEDNGPIYAWLNNGGDGHGGWTNRGQIANGLAGPGDRVHM